MEEITYRVVRSNRRSLCLEVTSDLQVIVRAPKGASEAVIAAFVERYTPWARRKLTARQAALEKRPEPTEAELLALIAEAKAVIPPRVAHFADVMGLRYTGVKISRARTRFGSCSPKDSLSFSCRLMRYPMEAIDYVVVHELAHIPHKNHGADFWRAVEAVLPDYKARRALLRD